MPKVREAVKEFFGKEPYKGVNPDEAVAVGAAIQGGVLSGKTTDILLLDVTPLSLGIETLGGIMTKLIPSNTTIPTKKTQTFSTAADNQTEVEIKVLQGDRAMAADNKILGRFNLVGIPPAPKGVPQIEVGFDIDANGIVSVTAKDKATGKEQRIQIKSDGGLSKTEIERMKQEAESHSAEDEMRRDSIEAKNQAEHYIYSVEQNLNKDYKDELSDAEKDTLKAKIQNAKDSLATNDKTTIENAKKELEDHCSKVFAEAYQRKSQKGAAGGDQGAQGGNQTGGEKVDDADFQDVSGDQKKP